jgi:hypothetical protein
MKMRQCGESWDLQTWDVGMFDLEVAEGERRDSRGEIEEKKSRGKKREGDLTKLPLKYFL